MNVRNPSAKELFVLGRVSMRPTYGHEIMRTLRESRADLWTEMSEKHVYYILKKLEREGMVRAETCSEDARPSRRVFSATPEGLREFERLIRAEGLIESMPYSDFDVVFGMLAYTERLTPAQKTDVLVRRREHLHSVIADAEAALRRVKEVGVPGLPTWMFAKVMCVSAAELGWLEEVLRDVTRDGWPAQRDVESGPPAGENESYMLPTNSMDPKGVTP